MFWVYTERKIEFIESVDKLLLKIGEDPNILIYQDEKWVNATKFNGVYDQPKITTELLNKIRADKEDFQEQFARQEEVTTPKGGFMGWLRKQMEDFFPPQRTLDESGIHAKLNYHVIVETQTRKLSLLFIGILLFSIVAFFGLYLFSITLDPVMSDNAIEGYTKLIFEIKEAGITEEPDLEKNTEFYWTVYYIRYLTVRILYASVFVAILFFLIRVYMHIREDRSVTMHREEALSAVQYIARGEWAYQINDKGDYIIDNTTGLPKKLPHLSIEDYDTDSIMRILPIQTLFTKPVSGKGKKNDFDPNLNTQLGLITIQLSNLLLNLEKKMETKPNAKKTKY